MLDNFDYARRCVGCGRVLRVALPRGENIGMIQLKTHFSDCFPCARILY